jgi:hypothetical protein
MAPECQLSMHSSASYNGELQQGPQPITRPPFPIPLSSVVKQAGLRRMEETGAQEHRCVSGINRLNRMRTRKLILPASHGSSHLERRCL